jgi:hypothetical protein
MIAYLLSDPEFYTTAAANVRSKVHQSIRVQIPNNVQASVLLHYGDIYYMAWKEICNSSGHDRVTDDSATTTMNETARNAFELEVLSDLIYASIYAEHASLVSSLHILLSKWYNYHPCMTKHTNHHQNGNKNWDDRTQFLYRMYTPIIWRATVSPNPTVRVNAIQTLLYVFPLSSSDTNQSSMTKVCTTIQQLLQDPDIKVRCTTSQVTTQLLLLYWDGIPTRYIHMILNGT